MVSPLISRLEKLEAKIGPPESALRCWRVVSDQGDEDTATALAQSHGFDRDNANHMLIMRCIVEHREQQRAAPRSPYMLAAA
jgi:hypothetical protein